MPDSELVSYVISLKNQARNERLSKEKIWKECWELYRGKQDYSSKMEWQSKLVLPKAFSSVKQATNIIKRMLTVSHHPWKIVPVNDEDVVAGMRAGQLTELVRQFMEMANYIEEFSIALECGFIMGFGVVKMWWANSIRNIPKPKVVPKDDKTISLETENETVVDSRLYIQAVDPFNFYWLPGSRINDWVGTIEESEVPKWQLVKEAESGNAPFDPEKIKRLQPMRISEERKLSATRFDEIKSWGGVKGSEIVKLTEYFGPIVMDNTLVNPNGHVIIGNDTEVLLADNNPFFHGKPPYIGFSPLVLPFRTDGIGIIEMVRDIDHSYNQLVNLAIDTGVFRLLPVFEAWTDAFENPEDLETGLFPGKIIQRSRASLGSPGLVPIPFQDISQGSVQLMAILDRAHQEGSLISEIQQALPRYRGIMTATETRAKEENQDNFFGGLASDIERNFLKPMVEMAMELVLQYIDTSTDPRIGKILGVQGSRIINIPMSEIIEIINGDYIVKVSGISEQIERMHMLQNLVQFMNILGQNPQMWMPYIKQDRVLRAVIGAFRPLIQNVDEFIETPEMVERKMNLMQQQAIQGQSVAIVPEIMKAVIQAQALQNKKEESEKRLNLEHSKAALEAAKLLSEIEARDQENATIPTV